MGLSVNYPNAMVVQDHVALISSEDLTHHRLCHWSHAGMVRLVTMVDGLDVPTEQTSYVLHVLQANLQGDLPDALRIPELLRLCGYCILIS